MYLKVKLPISKTSLLEKLQITQKVGYCNVSKYQFVTFHLYFSFIILF